MELFYICHIQCYSMQERFKQLLKEKNLTATQLAALIKVNASAMSHILNGRSKPSYDMLNKIAQAFPDINLNFLISGKGRLFSTSVDEGIEKKVDREQPVQTELFTEEAREIPVSPAKEASVPVPSAPAPAEQVLPPLLTARKKVRRIVLFFEDGTFEDYVQEEK